MSHPRILKLAIPVPLYQTYDYLAPEGALLGLGTRVLVPFGKRKAVGVVLGVADRSDVAASRLKRVERVLDDSALFSERALSLLTWAATYYRHPIGDVVQAAMPLWLRQGRPAISPTIRLWRASAAA